MTDMEKSRPSSIPRLPVLTEERSLDNVGARAESVTIASSPVQTQPQPQQPRARVYQEDVISPLDFNGFVNCVVLFCGVYMCCICSLPCSIPAMILSRKSREAAKSGRIELAKFLGNCALVLSVIALVTGFLGQFIGGLLAALYIPHLVECVRFNLSPNESGDPVNPLCQQEPNLFS